MFMSCNHSKKIAEEFAARQRAKELATKGHSKIAVAQTQKKKGPKTAVHNNAGKYDDESSTAPTENSGSRLGYTEKREMMKSQALDTVMTAIKEQEESLAKTNESIEMAYELARARLEVSHNKKSKSKPRSMLNARKVTLTVFVFACQRCHTCYEESKSPSTGIQSHQKAYQRLESPHFEPRRWLL